MGILGQFDLPTKMHHIGNANSKKVNPLKKLPQFPSDEKDVSVLKHLKKNYPDIKVVEFIDQSLK